MIYDLRQMARIARDGQTVDLTVGGGMATVEFSNGAYRVDVYDANEEIADCNDTDTIAAAVDFAEATSGHTAIF